VNQSNVIAAAFFVALFVFVTAKGQLPQYISYIL